MTSSALVPKRLLPATAFAAIVSVAVNLGVWGIGASVSRLTIGWPEVAVMSALGAVAGAVALQLLGRHSSRPRRHFALLTLVVVVLYALGPVSAMYAPYREGAERFNVATLLATEVMHLTSAGAVYGILTRYVLR
jgi:hypothetical protein